MTSSSEIPCANCRLWNAERKHFSCNPDKCSKLTEWLLDHSSLSNDEDENVLVIAPQPIQYVV